MPEKGKDIPTVFGELIRKLRNDKELTQEKLAELSQLHSNYISLLERGKRKPTIDTIFKIANALNMKPHVLIKKLEEAMNGI